jgi:hypothetical protein
VCEKIICSPNDDKATTHAQRWSGFVKVIFCYDLHIFDDTDAFTEINVKGEIILKKKER